MQSANGFGKSESDQNYCEECIKKAKQIQSKECRGLFETTKMQSQRRLLCLFGMTHIMDKVAFCKDCNHKAGEHGVFEDSDANEPHPCMRSDCNCNKYVPSE
jgi:hypothetical protein